MHRVAKLLRFRELDVARVPELKSLQVIAGTDRAPGDATARHFARAFVPPLRWFNPEAEISVALPRAEDAGDASTSAASVKAAAPLEAVKGKVAPALSKSSVRATFVDGRSVDIDLASKRAVDIFAQLIGVRLPPAAGSGLRVEAGAAASATGETLPDNVAAAILSYAARAEAAGRGKGSSKAAREKRKAASGKRAAPVTAAVPAP